MASIFYSDPNILSILSDPNILALVDWSGRILREGKRGAIDEKLPPIFDRLQIDPQRWLYLNRNFESRFKSLVGTAHSMRSACERLGKRWAKEIRDCEHYFSHPPLPDPLFFY